MCCRVLRRSCDGLAKGFAKARADSPASNLTCGIPVDPSTWYYYTTLTGTLTGIGNYAGAVIDVSRFMQAFQVGAGANGKNTLFGASGWFHHSSQNSK